MPVRRIHVVVEVHPNGEHLVFSGTSDLLFAPGEAGALRAGTTSVDEVFLSTHAVLDLELGRTKRWLQLHGGQLSE